MSAVLSLLIKDLTMPTSTLSCVANSLKMALWLKSDIPRIRSPTCPTCSAMYRILSGWLMRVAWTASNEPPRFESSMFRLPPNSIPLSMVSKLSVSWVNWLTSVPNLRATCWKIVNFFKALSGSNSTKNFPAAEAKSLNTFVTGCPVSMANFCSLLEKTSVWFADNCIPVSSWLITSVVVEMLTPNFSLIAAIFIRASLCAGYPDEIVWDNLDWYSTKTWFSLSKVM